MRGLHVCLLTISVIAYVLVGALIFYLLDCGDDCSIPCAKRLLRLMSTHDVESYDFTTALLAKNTDLNISDVMTLAKMLITDISRKDTNTYGDNVIMAISAITTIGYGRRAPETNAARLFCVLFVLIGIPLSLFLLAVLGEKLRQTVAKAGNKCLINTCTDNSKWILFNEILILTLVSLFIFLVLPAGMFCQNLGWSVVDHIYYVVITIMTVGFGDLIPLINPEWSSVGKSMYVTFFIIWLYFSLAWMSMLIRMVIYLLRKNMSYENIESSLLGSSSTRREQKAIYLSDEAEEKP